MTAFTGLVLLIAGFTILALSQTKHHRTLFSTPQSNRRRKAYQAAGWAVLALSLERCVTGSGWSLGLILWFGLLTIAALIVSLSITYGPHAASRRAEHAPPRSTNTCNGSIKK